MFPLRGYIGVVGMESHIIKERALARSSGRFSVTANNRLSTPGSPGQQADGDCALTVKGVFLYYVSRNFSAGGMAERLIAAVLKTVEGHTSGGSNPSPSTIVAARRVLQQGRSFPALFAFNACLLGGTKGKCRLGHGACAAMQAPYFETRKQHTVLFARMRFSTSSHKILLCNLLREP